MIWEKEADQAVKKVPFFVRKKVYARVEAFAADQGRSRVTLQDVKTLKKKFLSQGGMESEVKGYEVSACFGDQGCPNAVASSARLIRDIEALMAEADLLSFLRSQVTGALKFHHEFRVSISGCPNGCSRPQITDIGIIGAALPGITQAPCSLCKACESTCPDRAVVLGEEGPKIDFNACLACGNCIKACPTGTLEIVNTGYRVMLGGRLGRHPRLGMAVPGIFSHQEVLELVRRCLGFYKTQSRGGKRFSHLLESLSQVL